MGRVILGILLAVAPGIRLFPVAAGGGEAVVAGTVFREPGFALPGAKVVLTPVAPAQEGSAKAKIRPQSQQCNSRGEFAFRVPAGQSSYVIKAEAPGYRAGTREVEVHGAERVDVYITLSPESGK